MAMDARFHRLAAPQIVMLANAALFVLGATLDLGIPVGPLAEPRVLAASVTRAVCALALLAGGLAPLYAPRFATIAAAVGNVIALAGITVSVIALSLGAGPHTITNDICCASTTSLALASICLLLIENSSLRRA
jgi:hypothetical protein